MDDIALLRRYVEERAEDAFTELVRRHMNLVYGAALRQTNGNAALSSDVAQAVFSDLSRKAASLMNRAVLTGWLYTSTRFAAANARRTEARRHVREQEAYAMQEIVPTSDGADWGRLRPVIDDALHTLDETDREAVLLRFFEGRAFAEIGAVLRLSEEASRKRVARALDKMAAALSQRGVTSTSSALALALAQQPAVAAPAGLAASVASSVLAGAAAASGALGWTTMHFMSSAKLTAGATAALAVLCSSLVGNAWLLARTRADAVPSSSHASASSATRVTNVPAVAITDLAGDQLVTVRDRLRTAGTSEASIRSILEGLLRWRYREKLSTLHAERYRDSWWRLPEIRLGPTGRPTPADDPGLLKEMVLEPLERLLGRDPLEIAEVDARYAYVPAELRLACADLDEEFALAQSSLGPAQVDGTRDELERQRQRIDAKREQLAATLAPAQRAEYNMRHSPFAVSLMRRMELVGGSESEYRAAFAVVGDYAQALAQLPTGEGAFAARQELDQRTAQQFVVALGFDRAVDYIWSGVWEYSAYARVARESNLSPGTVGRVFQLAAETADRALAISFNPALTIDQKRAALAVLQQQVRPELDALLPIAAQQRLAPETLSWITGLGEGRYRVITTTMHGNPGSIINSGTMIGPTPVTPHRRTQLLPRRLRTTDQTQP